MYRRMMLSDEIKKVATVCYLESGDIRYLKIADEISSCGQLRTWY